MSLAPFCSPPYKALPPSHSSLAFLSVLDCKTPGPVACLQPHPPSSQVAGLAPCCPLVVLIRLLIHTNGFFYSFLSGPWPGAPLGTLFMPFSVTIPSWIQPHQTLVQCLAKQPSCLQHVQALPLVLGSCLPPPNLVLLHPQPGEDGTPPFSPPDRDRRGDSPAWSGRGSRPSRRTSG